MCPINERICSIREERLDDMYLLCSLVKMYEFMTFRAVELLSAKFRIRGRKINGADQPSEAKSTPPWWWQGNKIENELDKMASGCQNTCPPTGHFSSLT